MIIIYKQNDFQINDIKLNLFWNIRTVTNSSDNICIKLGSCTPMLADQTWCTTSGVDLRTSMT